MEFRFTRFCLSHESFHHGRELLRAFHID
jgi:hypothetical protein